jgi:hypothetical protein
MHFKFLKYFIDLRLGSAVRSLSWIDNSFCIIVCGDLGVRVFSMIEMTCTPRTPFKELPLDEIAVHVL